MSKLNIVSFERSLFDPRLIYLYTPDGLLHAREHYRHQNWFATSDGRVLRLTNRAGLCEQTLCKSTAKVPEGRTHICKNGKRQGQVYLQIPTLTFICNRTICAHRFIYECWKGPVEAGMTIDHLNGDKYDNRIVNLDVVTTQENIRRHHLLSAMRNSTDNDGKPLWNMAYYHERPWLLKELFSKDLAHLTHVPTDDQINYELNHHCEY